MAGIDQSRMLVAAIDFGTTFSGYAFSFRSDFEKDPLKIHANQWTTGLGSNVSLKTSTCVLFKPNKEFHSFGFDAEDKYSELAMGEQHSDWYYFRRFKMMLYDKQAVFKIPCSRCRRIDAFFFLGGTIDITVHEVQVDGRLKELYKANGGHWGGTKVDEAFQQLLVDIAGVDVMDDFYLKHRDDYLDLFREFELKKRTITPEMDQIITIKLPLSLHDEFVHHRGEDFRKSMLMRQKLSGKLTFAGDKLRLDPEIMKDLFSDTCSSIVGHLREIFGERSVRGTDTILMVGGFSESPVLRQAIKDNFPDKKVVIPNEAGLSVLKGAVIFGHKPAIVIQRVSRFTYGVKSYTSFLPNVHEENRRKEYNGKSVCSVFDKHVEIGQPIPSSGMFEERRYYPLDSRTPVVKIAVYTSTDNQPMYVDDRGCEKLGELIVEYEGNTSGKDRPVMVKMIFGGTELGIEAVEEKTGKQTRAAFNFLGETNA